MNPENQYGPESRDPKTTGELLPEELQGIIIRQADSELLAARSELIRLQDIRSAGGNVDPNELESVNRYVVELELASRSKNITPSGEQESVSLLANALRNVQIAKDEAGDDIISQEIILATQMRLDTVRRELFHTQDKQ